MWLDELKRIKEEKKEYEEEINDSASNKEIELLKKESNKNFKYELNEEYIEFLKKINGLEFNGYILYGIDDCLLEKERKQSVTGYIEANKSWYENEAQKKYMFIGESSIGWYCYDRMNHCFVELDKPSVKLIKKYENLNNMLEKILNGIRPRFVIYSLVCFKR